MKIFNLSVGALLAAALLPLAQAAEGGRNYLSIEMQYVEQKNYRDSSGKKISLGGTLVARTIQFDWYHDINDQWTVSLGVPWVSKKYSGPIAHDPLALDTPRPNREFYDDGEYHNAFANIEAGVYRHFSYRDIHLSPFILLEIPSHNYDIFGLAAPGDGLKKLGVGLQAGSPIGFTNFYLRGEYMYMFAETAPGGVNVDHHRFQAEVGYFFNEQWTARVFALGRIGNGLDFPEDYPSLTDDIFYYHDQTMSHEFVNVGVGVEYRINSKYSLSSWTQQLIDGKNSNTTEQALYLQLGISF